MSIELFFPGTRSQRWQQVGPLVRDLDGFAVWLAAQGYARRSARTKLRLVRHLSLWLESERLGAEALDEERFETFLLARGPRNVRNGEAATGRQLLIHLRHEGRIPEAPEDTDSTDAITRVARTYEHFLVNERGLSPVTVGKYLPVVHAFLTERFGSRAVALESLVARDANRFIVRHAISRSNAKGLATALRSFLRHLHQRGDIAADLAGAIPPITNWRLSELPKSLPPEKVESVLASCDRNTAVGRRDHAILLLLARLGLRGGEVATLTLEDIDWDKGLVTLISANLFVRAEIALNLQHSLPWWFRQAIGDRAPAGDHLRQREGRLDSPDDLLECEPKVAPAAMRATSRTPRGKWRWRGGSASRRAVP